MKLFFCLPITGSIVNILPTSNGSRDSSSFSSRRLKAKYLWSVVNLQLNNFGVSIPKESDENDGGSPKAESGDDIGDLTVVTWKGAPTKNIFLSRKKPFILNE